MEIITEQIIQDTWKTIDEIPLHNAQNRMINVYKEQPKLSEFIVSQTYYFNDEIGKLATYIFSIIYMSIKSQYQKKFNKIPYKTIIKSFKNNEKYMESMQYSHDVFIEKAAEQNTSKQPYLYDYITFIIFEDAIREIDMSEDEQGYLFLIFKTVIDVLNDNIN